ncbi:MAG: ATP-binding protein [Rhodospirillales bacterium]|nr:ATP-binding protein [Rhodospirillales bacterium]
MKRKFVQTSNVKRFLNAYTALGNNAAPEACWMMAVGDAGLGKTRAGVWWGLKNPSVTVRLKAACTPRWLLTDLAKSLGENAPGNSCQVLFEQVCQRLIQNPKTIILDEVENGIRHIETLETVRDITDYTEVPVIALGREWVWSKLQALAQFETRVSSVAEFTKLTLEDVRLCASELAEVDITDDACVIIFENSKGKIRNIIKSIAKAENIGKRNGQAVTADHLKGA